MSNELPIHLYKANAELQLQITRLLQESGLHLLEAMQKLSAGGVLEITSRIQGLQQAADWQGFATLRQRCSGACDKAAWATPKRSARQQARARRPLPMACARRSRLGRSLSPRHSAPVAAQPLLRTIASDGRSPGPGMGVSGATFYNWRKN